MVTERTCESCHLEGWRNAPRANHAWLPPLHMDKISCRTCHIPTRAVKSALVQASDIYNPAPRITPPPKHIWTFYDQEMAFWNHYGELELFTAKDEPTNVTRPTLILYKGKIYPANRVHSTWMGFEEEGKPGLNQLFMKDFFQMWTQHRSDPKNKHPELANITDDNKDGVVEINRPAEIDALLSATRAYLAATGFPISGRRLVWVSDSRAWYSSTEFRDLPHEEYEATAYASVYKFSHDVAPAKAALGAGGCTDCHRAESPVFQGAVLAEPFSGDNARPRWMPNHEILAISSFWVRLGALREVWLKPLVYSLLAAVLLLMAGLGLKDLLVRRFGIRQRAAAVTALAFAAAGLAAFGSLATSADWLSYVAIRRFTLNANHAWISLLVFAVSAAVALLRANTAGRRLRMQRWLHLAVAFGLSIAAISGILIFVKITALTSLTRLTYTKLEVGFAVALIGSAAILVFRLILAITKASPISRRSAPAGGN